MPNYNFLNVLKLITFYKMSFFQNRVPYFKSKAGNSLYLREIEIALMGLFGTG
jgi:hypothetical protein